MKRKGWYILSYDISDTERLKKVHRVMQKSGLAVQKSVFFVHGTEQSIGLLLGRLEPLIKKTRDDIRAYPVGHPSKVWTTGGPLQTFPLITPGIFDKSFLKTGKKRLGFSNKFFKASPSLWKKMFGIFKPH